MEAIYEELKTLARRHLAHERHPSIEPADLINEAYLRFKKTPELFSQGKVEFLATASRVMRRVAVDIARQQRSSKRGGGTKQGGLSETSDFPMAEERVLEIDMALDALALLDARQSRTVELKLFASLADEEIANILNVSVRTVKRDWALARAWLQAYLGSASRTIQ
jgi:RNA polymerase sigma factor (TIGR02999 family)